VITGSLLTAAVVVIVLGFGAVGVLVAMVRTKRGFADFDLSAARFGATHATAVSTHVLRTVTQLGGAVVLVPAVVVLAIIEVWRQRTAAVAAFLTVAVGGQFLAADLTKTFVDRARPDISRLTGFSGTSFPSGHATAAAASFAAAALVLGRGRPRSVKAALAGVAVGMAAVIATSRVMLGVHWLTDVMAGLCLGWAWFALTSVAFGGRLLRFGAPVADAEAAADAIEDAGDRQDPRRPARL
jgi:undecaprenyl-diphosphatase